VNNKPGLSAMVYPNPAIVNRLNHICRMLLKPFFDFVANQTERKLSRWGVTWLLQPSYEQKREK
jgi:hypothetical protein